MGTTGATGITGPIGLTGAGTIRSYRYILSNNTSGQTVTSGSDVIFNATSVGITDIVFTPPGATLTLNTSGIYKSLLEEQLVAQVFKDINLDLH